MTAIYVVSGVLPLWRLGTLLTRQVLGFARPMTLQFSSAGLSVAERLEWSGRVLKDTRRWIPRENLARVSREASSSRAGMYAGLSALLLGTYLGTSRVLDGIGVFGGSPALWGSGLLLLLLGVVIDFALWSGRDVVRARCQVTVVPRSGRSFSCRGLDRQQADLALRALESTLSAPLTASDDSVTEHDSATARPAHDAGEVERAAPNRAR